MAFLYGASLYDTLIYSAETIIYEFVGTQTYDFKVIWSLKSIGTVIPNVQWELYKRDYTKDTDIIIDDTHTLVDSGSFDGTLEILLSNYGNLTRFTKEDYFLKTYKNQGFINHRSDSYIQYYPAGYHLETGAKPYFQSDIRVKRQEVGGSSDGSPKSRIVERPMPIVVVKQVLTKDEQEIDVILLGIEEPNV